LYIFDTKASYGQLNLNAPMELAKEIVNRRYEIDHIENVLEYSSTRPSHYAHRAFGYLRPMPTLRESVTDIDDSFIYVQNDVFREAHSGLKLFCKLFFQDVVSDKNLLNISTPVPFSPPDQHRDIKPPAWSKALSPKNVVDYNDYFYQSAPEDISHWNIRYQRAMRESIRFLTGLPHITFKDVESLNEVFLRHPDNEFLCAYFSAAKPTTKVNERPIQSVSLKEIQELYYETVASAVGRGHGAYKRIADIAGRDPSTITNNFKKEGKFEKLGNQNFIPQKRLLIIDTKNE